jgi:hypothetical protein
MRCRCANTRAATGRAGGRPLYQINGHQRAAGIAETVMMKMMEQDNLVLPVHDSFITNIGRTQALIDIMKDAYRDIMRAEVRIDADPSFIDDLTREDPNSELEAPDAWQAVDWQQQQPDYAGYRERLNSFIESRPSHWFDRFGLP